MSALSGRIEQLFELLDPKLKSPPPRQPRPERNQDLDGLNLDAEQEAAIAKLLAKKGRGKEEPQLPQRKMRVSAKVNVLGESDEEADIGEGLDREGAEQQPVERAVMLLT